jgi:glutamate dehydrogenase/leucine dehydrogenase
VAVHSTALGPAIGGCRLRHYSTWRDGLSDALRLAAAMTDKCSLAGIDHGGGKTVAVLPADPVDATLRTDLVLDIADVIGSFNGVYLTGPDVAALFLVVNSTAPTFSPTGRSVRSSSRQAPARAR